MRQDHVWRQRGQILRVPTNVIGFGSQRLERIDSATQELSWRDAKIQKLTFEIAQLRRVRFGAQSERLRLLARRGTGLAP